MNLLSCLSLGMWTFHLGNHSLILIYIKYSMTWKETENSLIHEAGITLIVKHDE